MRALKLSGYVSWFFTFFVVGVYLTFPLDDLRGLITERLESALGKGKQGNYGVDPKVALGSLALSGFGIKAERVSVQLPSRDPEPGPTIDIDELAVGVRPWTLLSKVRTVRVAADLYGGSVDATVSVDEKGAVHDADVDVDGFDLGKIPVVQEKLGVPVSGKLDLSAELELGATPEKDGSGKVTLDLKGASLGPGNLKLAAAFGGFELPLIDLGSLSGEIPVKQGRGTLNGVKLDGKDVQLELLGDVFFKGNLATSRLDLDGWFMPTTAFLEREKKFQSLLQLGESLGGGVSLSKAKDEEGHYWFSLKGPLQSPSALLSRDAGKRARTKANKGLPPRGEREQPDTKPPPPALPSKPVEDAAKDVDPESAG